MLSVKSFDDTCNERGDGTAPQNALTSVAISKKNIDLSSMYLTMKKLRSNVYVAIRGNDGSQRYFE